MSGAIREISVERGEDPRAFTLVAFGGAGPMHGNRLIEKLNALKLKAEVIRLRSRTPYGTLVAR